MDTGDPRMNIPSEVLSAIIAAGKAEQEPDTGSYIVDCDADLPDLVLTIAGKEYAIPSKEYILDVRQFFKFSSSKTFTGVRLTGRCPNNNAAI